MRIIKKDGRIQEFNEKKVFISIDNASKDVEEIVLNESDINILVSDIIKKIKTIRGDETPTSSYEVTGIIMDVLIKDGFSAVIKSFLEHNN